MIHGGPATRCRSLLLAGPLLAGLAAGAAAQDSTFLLTTSDPAYHTPAFLGNGAFSLVTAALGTTPAASFAAGVEDAAPGDVPRIAELPAWNPFDVWDGQAWLDAAPADTAHLRGYSQTLDTFDGELRTVYEWVDGERRTAVSVEAFVSRADPDVAAVRLRLTPRQGGILAVRASLREWPAPERLALARLERSEPGWTAAQVWYPGHVTVRTRDAAAHGDGGDLFVGGTTDGRGTPMAIAAQVRWPGDLRPDSVRRVPSDSGAVLEAWFTVPAGRTITIEKYVGVATAAAGAIPRARAEAASRRAAARGYEAVKAAHEAAWHRFWETDVVVDGDPALQRVIHAMLFSLLSSVRAGSSESIPPMGLSSGGYYGHVFWDADTWMFPALLLLHPDLARSLVDFRARTLPAARANAAAHGYRGAMYPWESDYRGDEAVPRFAAQNGLYENHVTADVALAQWQYFLATGDSAWLATTGFPVLRATADFWVSRAAYDSATGGYAIRHVVSVDEGLIGVGNDTYTNAVARRNLEAAVAAARRLGRESDPRWARVAAGLVVPYDSVGQYHPTFLGAPDSLRGSVVPLLAYPLGWAMSVTAKRNDLEAAVRRLFREGPGAMMTVTLYPVVAAELGDRALLDSLVPESYRGFLRPPFGVLAETPRSEGTDFLTGAGGFLQQVEYGWTGLRWEEGPAGLVRAFPPLLPTGVRGLTLRNVTARGQRFDVIVRGDRAELRPR